MIFSIPNLFISWIKGFICKASENSEKCLTDVIKCLILQLNEQKQQILTLEQQAGTTKSMGNYLKNRSFIFCPLINWSIIGALPNVDSPVSPQSNRLTRFLRDEQTGLYVWN